MFFLFFGDIHVTVEMGAAGSLWMIEFQLEVIQVVFLGPLEVFVFGSVGNQGYLYSYFTELGIPNYYKESMLLRKIYLHGNNYCILAK